MKFNGRQDCAGADAMGAGGPTAKMPGPDMTTHELLDFFATNFGFTAYETVTIMGVHSVATATPLNSGFGNNNDKEEGWVCDAADYVLNNRYYSMLAGKDNLSTPMWTQVTANAQLIENWRSMVV